jgi:hypothetical protein
MTRRELIPHDFLIEQGATPGDTAPRRRASIAACQPHRALIRALVPGLLFVLSLLFLLGSAPSRAQASDRQQMKGLDEQVQEIKSDVLGISAELSQLEEKLLYPSGTQVAVFVALAPGDQTRLDSVRLQIDGRLVAHYIYSFKELDALRKGGVQRLYVGNLPTGAHQLQVQLDGKLPGGADYSRSEQFSFSKGVEPKHLGLTLAGPDSGRSPIELGNW